MRQITILGTALAAALVLAYTVWTDDSDPNAEETIEVYRTGNGGISRIDWSADNDTAVIERRTDPRGEYLWVTVTETTEVARAIEPDVDTDTAEADPQPPVTETKTVSFKGNGQAGELWENFSPLRAMRDLSSAPGTAAFGLDEPAATMSVVTATETLELHVGGETYGSRDRYVGLGERIFLVDDRTLRPLQFAKTRLVERSLIPYSTPDIERITVQIEGRQGAWTQENRDDRGQSYWAVVGTPNTGDEEAKTWIQKVLAVRASAYVDADSLDTELVPVVTWSVTGSDGSWNVEVLAEAGNTDTPTYYARSEFNRSLVELTRSLAADAFADVDQILP